MLNIAILGTGAIAGKMAETIGKMQDVCLYAAASRTKEKAQEFAAKYAVRRVFERYEDMVKDPAVDLVYIASPHMMHYEHMKICLEYGKAVLCEKPFTVCAKQAEEIFALAEKRGCFITEALWTRYMPFVDILQEMIKEGKIGHISSMTANLGYSIQHVPRLREPGSAGGALLDLGIYLLHFARLIFGRQIKQLSSTAVLSELGVDLTEGMTLEFEEGQIAALHSSMCAALDRRAVLYGEEGYIEITNINNPEKIERYDRRHICQERIYMPEQISGLEYEVECCRQALENGWKECPKLPHEETLEVLRLMDGMRKEWGMKY